jgi:hypothetical protein
MSSTPRIAQEPKHVVADPTLAQKSISQKEALKELLAEKQSSLDLSPRHSLAASLPSYVRLRADQITGAAISVDGGWTAQWLTAGIFDVRLAPTQDLQLTRA